MLKVENVTKKYGKVLANDNVNFELESGSVAVLLGPNGAGKSTIMKAIVGLLRFKGKITICDFDNKSIEAKALLGYVPEMPAVYDMLTVSEHMQFILRAYKMQDNGYADSLLERFELSDKKEKLGKELSKGMQQKLSLCCALVHEPKFIVFDEPMVGLDPHAIKELQNVFVELAQKGTTVLISTHMLSSVEGIWDRVFIMKDGQIKVSKTKSELGENGDKSLEDLFFKITESGDKS